MTVRTRPRQAPVARSKVSPRAARHGVFFRSCHASRYPALVVEARVSYRCHNMDIDHVVECARSRDDCTHRASWPSPSSSASSLKMARTAGASECTDNGSASLSPPGLLSMMVAAYVIAACDPALAAATGMAEELSYNPEQGSETFKNIAGVGYIILVIFYFFRLFKKRAERATTEAFASTAQAAKDRMVDDPATVENDLAALDGPAEASPASAERAKSAEVTVTQCLIGVAQAGAICFGFYLLSRVVDDYFLHQDIPTQYTARNVTLLIQSVVRGLVYLVTFIFGANATGLAALAIQLVVDPEGVDRGLDQTPKKRKEVLPKVKVTDDIGSLRRAFKEAERMGQQEKK